MYVIEVIEIQGFWGRASASCAFDSDVNIIIGRNGTGKTTFMNILNAILSVDLDGIVVESFNHVNILFKRKELLGDQDDYLNLEVRTLEDDHQRFPNIVEYFISGETYHIRVASSQGIKQIPPVFRSRLLEEREKLKHVLSKIVALSSLSVYRLRSGEDLELRDGRNSEYINPVDYRLSNLLQSLTTYQLVLSQKSRAVSTELQKDVLTSILYTEDDLDYFTPKMEFDKYQETRNLNNAFMRLNSYDESVRRKINFHVDSIDKSLKSIRERRYREKENVDYRAIEAFIKTQKIIKLSLDAEEKINNIYILADLLISTIHDFIKDKEFFYDSAGLKIQSKYGNINIDSLSSGEKQLLILLIETVLQNGQPYVFLTDEPELSLHVEWQRKIIPAIRKLNPNAQVIAATHSPEIASRYREKIIHMGKIIHELP
ncbi:AAA family ATPase [Morganella morganii subsp. morganii]|uniref:AAA family ATPase n=1 Tax=Morganella morganii TaxID=582 RepID=UPI001BDA8959|nr:AAA family ATPase [Morganella morganii]MBT0394333.1 AAA family ATPase [Morganella morganii subsp. morganii]